MMAAPSDSTVRDGPRRTPARLKGRAGPAALADRARPGITGAAAVMLLDAEGRIVCCNRRADTLLGRSLAAGRGSTWVALSPRAQRAAAAAELNAAWRGVQSPVARWRRAAAHGRRIEVSSLLARVDGPARAPSYVVAVEQDAAGPDLVRAELNLALGALGLPHRADDTSMHESLCLINAGLADRAKTEHDLRETRGRLDVVFRTAAEGIVTINRRGIIDSFNPAAERIFGYSASELVGRHVGLLMRPTEGRKHDSYVRRYLRSGVKKVIGIGREVTGRRKDGSTFPMDLAVGEGVDGDGPVFTGIIRDLSVKKQNDDTLRSAERLAAIGTLAAGLGHDMNNVLLPVRAHLNALRAAGESGAIPPPEREHTEAIVRSIAYLQQLADGLHFLAMNPEVRAHDAGTDLRVWWERSGPLLSNAAPRHARVSCSIPGGLPRVPISPHELTQAVLNLLVNAGEAIPPGSRRRGRINVWADAVGGDGPRRVRLGVTDNGRGMSAEVRRRAFEIFFTTKPRGMGTGLGLPLVQKSVVRAGGQVEIESVPGRGTTVTMLFPPADERDPGRPPRSAAVTTDDGRAAAVTARILEGLGWRSRRTRRPGAAEAWIAESASIGPREAAAWWARRPSGRLVLLGKPGPAWLGRIRAGACRVVRDRGDLNAIRAAVGWAASGV